MKDITVFKNDRTGVSPVIGVILMVAVTVIIAAVIGSTALGLGDSVSESPPQASFEFEQADFTLVDNQGETRDIQAVYIEHTAGESVDPKDIKVTVDGKPTYAINNKTDPSYPLHWNDDGSMDSDSWVEAVITEPFEEERVNEESISAGDRTRLGMQTTYFDETGAAIRGDDFDNRKVYAFDGGDTFFFDGENADGDGTRYVDEGDYSTSRLESGDTIRIIYDSGGGSSQELASYEVK